MDPDLLLLLLAMLGRIKKQKQKQNTPFKMIRSKHLRFLAKLMKKYCFA